MKTNRINTTPLPWKVGTINIDDQLHLGIFHGDARDGDKVNPVCLLAPMGKVDALDEANAELITRAVNAHQQLVDALRACLDYIPGSAVRSWPPGFELKRKALELARDVLSKLGAS